MLNKNRIKFLLRFGGLIGAGLLFLFWQDIVDYFYRPDAFDDRFQETIERRVAAGRYGQVDSLLIWHDGEMVTELYFNGYDADQLHPVYSITKSVTSLGIGLAVEQDRFPPLSTPIGKIFEEYHDETSADWETITIEQLLTMSDGFRWDEIEGDSFDQLFHSEDWIGHLLAIPIDQPPGTQFNYNTGSTIAAGEILSRSIEQPAAAFIQEELFAPLGITSFKWPEGPNGASNTGSGLELRPRDLVKIGRLMLDDGRWQGRQLVAEEWIDLSTRPHRTDNSWPYGYMWWRLADDDRAVRNLAQNDVVFASGYAAQFIFVVPHLDLVVVTTAANTEQFDAIFPLLYRYVFPAAQ